MEVFAFSAIISSTVAAAIIIIGAWVAFAVVSFYLVSKYLTGLRQEGNNKFTSFIFGVVASLYSILLGFVVVLAWQDFNGAKTQTTTEVTQASTLLLNAGGFPPGPRQEIRTGVLNYLYRVAEDEFVTMEDGEADPTTEAAYDRIWDAFYAYTPQKDQEKTFYSSSVSKLGALAEARDQRIRKSQAAIPTPLWILLIAGGIVTVVFTHLFWTKSKKTHLFGAVTIAALLGLVIFLIFGLQRPFTGDIRVSPKPYTDLAAQWADRPL